MIRFISLAVGILVAVVSSANAVEVPQKIDNSGALHLMAEAIGQVDADYLVDDSDGTPFFVFNGLSRPPAEGSFGYFAVNPWTGDVWNLWGCHRLSTPALRKSQAAIERRFTRAELKQYDRLRDLKPECTVETP
jgi:hypothetical protein